MNVRAGRIWKMCDLVLNSPPPANTLSVSVATLMVGVGSLVLRYRQNVKDMQPDASSTPVCKTAPLMLMLAFA